MSAIPALPELQRKLPIKTKLAYGLGTLAFGIKDQGFGALLMLYYNQVIGLPAAWVGAAIMAAMIVDAVIDPLIGHLSDHSHSRWGRRHPFMYASALPIAVSYLFLWSPPAVSPALQCAWLVASAIAVRVSVSLFEIPNYTLTTELTESYEERTSLQTWRGVFLAVGGALLGLVTYKYFLVPTADGRPGQFNQAGYVSYSRVAAVVMFLAVLLSSWGTQDRAHALVSHGPRERITLRGFIHGLRILLLDKVYASLMWANLSFAITAGLSGTLIVYLFTYFWRVDSSRIGTVTASAVLALFLAVAIVMLTRHLDKKRMAMILLGLTLFFFTVPQAAGLIGLVTPQSPLLMSYLIFQYVSATTCVLALGILCGSMVADVGDHFKLKWGSHLEGLMFSILVMINKAVSGLGVFAASLLLTLVGFPEKAQPGQVSDQVVLHLGWVYIASVVILCSFALLCLRLFPMTRAVHADILARLEQARAQGAEV